MDWENYLEKNPIQKTSEKANWDQNHYSNLTSKIMKMCEQIFEKRQRPNTIQILWIAKK